MEKIKVIEMFAGYGGASFGLKKAGIPFECVGYSEIDKYAIQCFEQNHKGKNFGDCSKIDLKDLPDFDLLTGGFPCQDVSLAGKRDLEGGRTNLYEEILRIAAVKLPRYILLENVKGLTSMKIDERALHLKIAADLNKLGYGVCWKVLNSKDYGIPQNRERIWFVCKLGGWNFMEFMFPNPIELKIFLKDILEENIEDKYYLNEEQIKKLIKRNENFNMKGNRFIDSENKSFSGLTCNENHNDKLIIHSLFPRSGNPKQGGTGHLSKKDNISYCIDTGNCQAVEYDVYNNKIKKDGISITLTEPHHNNLRLIENKRIRKLTPKECFRLMGFLDDEINLEGLSDTQKYKLAGNGWDVSLVSKILKNMIKSEVKPIKSMKETPERVPII